MKQHTSQLARFARHPAEFVKRAFYKVVVAPIVYGKGGDYDAARYWGKRFEKYGLSLRGPGDEGMTEQENRAMYGEAEHRFRELCALEGVSFSGKRVMEIGCGTGFYTRLIHEGDPAAFTGIDITDVLFDQHRRSFPGSTFLRRDAASDALEGQFDVVVMIDVIQHIVTPPKFDHAMASVRGCLAPGGAFILSPVRSVTRRNMFHDHSWSLPDVRRNFPGHSLGTPTPFRDAGIVVIHRPA